MPLLTPLSLPEIVAEAPCPQCGGEMVRRRGPYSLFWGCAAYPKCRGRLPLAASSES